jgi:hypothetical protein
MDHALAPLVVAFVFLWYAREALKDNDSALALIANTVASGFVVAAGVFPAEEPDVRNRREHDRDQGGATSGT